MTGLTGALAAAVAVCPERPAVVEPDGWGLTYAELDRAAAAVAGGLAARRVGPGDVVALLLPSSIEHLVLSVAVSRRGAVVAGINPRLAPPQRRAQVALADPALVVGTAELLDGGGVEVAIAGGPEDLLRELRSAPVPALTAGPDAPVAIVFTSGTSGGAPKAAVFTAGQLAAIDAIDTGGAPDGSGGPLLVSTELVHVGAVTKLAWYLRLGSTLHVLRRWRAADALRVISAARIPTVGGIAAQVALMLRDPEFERHDFAHVTAVVAGGGPSSPALVAEAERRFGAPYSNRYSSTESGGVGTANGRPRPGVQVDVRESRVWLRSPAVMAGYWRDPETTRATLVDGWLRTDDLGELDDRGLLRLHGRADAAFVRGGYNVHPEAVEAVLAGHPAVADIAVVPRDDPRLGQVAVAVVVTRDGTDPPDLAALRTFGALHLAKHELPDALLTVPQLPRSPTHKLDRGALAELTTRQMAPYDRSQ